jgi:hypothetical protein
MVVPIENVIPYYPATSRRAVARMRAVLEIQGQIEPLQVRRVTDNHWCAFAADPWGAEIIQAAQELGWQTLLIVEMAKYE